jgi:hypothetical protein
MTQRRREQQHGRLPGEPRTLTAFTAWMATDEYRRLPPYERGATMMRYVFLISAARARSERRRQRRVDAGLPVRPRPSEDISMFFFVGTPPVHRAKEKE